MHRAECTGTTEVLRSTPAVLVFSTEVASCQSSGAWNESKVRLLHFGKICGPLFVPNFMWLAWKICLIFAVRSKTEFRFSPAAIIFCVARNNLLHRHYTFFPRYKTTQNFRALYYVALLSLPPPKFALPSCWCS